MDLPGSLRITVSEQEQNQHEKRLSAARGQRTDAQQALNSAANEALGALKEAKELCAELAEERAQAQQIFADAESIKVEADTYYQRKTEEANNKAQQIVTGAESSVAKTSTYCVQVTAEALNQAQAIIVAAENTKAVADAYYERLTAEANQNVLAAEKSRSEADTYQDELVAETWQWCKDLMRETVLVEEVGVRQLDVQNNLDLVATEPGALVRKFESQGNPKTSVQPKRDANSPILSVENGTPRGAPTNNNSSGAGNQGDGGQILGLDLSGSIKAFPIKTIMAKLIINDSIAGNDVVVTFEPTLEAGQAFNRRVDGRELTFYPLNTDGGGLMLMRDEETGTQWETLTGRAVNGPLTGHKLATVNFEHARLSSWRTRHPNTQIYQDAS